MPRSMWKKGESMEERVYFIHKAAGFGLAADFFIKGIKPVNSREEAEEVADIDYYMPDCEYVEEFLKKNPDYVYVGSTDNMHYGGWAMSFDGYEEVECPEVGVLMLVYIVQKLKDDYDGEWENILVCKVREQAVQYIREHPDDIYWIDEVESEGF